MPRRARVFAPATVANVACGFDIFGFAVEQPGDELDLRLTGLPGTVQIDGITGDGGRLPTDPAQNTAGVALRAFMDTLDAPPGAAFTLHKQMPLGSGLGSSAASAVASLFAYNALLPCPQPPEALLPFAVEGERLACGSAHADNVAPSLLGGFVLIRSYDPLDVVRLPAPPDLCCALVHPDLEVKTRDAREILRQRILLRDAIVQWGNVAGLVAGLLRADYELIGRSLEDVIVEPVRAILIPGFVRVKAAALAAGALGCGISGSGPSLFALAAGPRAAGRAAEAMAAVFADLGVACTTYVSAINQVGPRVLATED